MQNYILFYLKMFDVKACNNVMKKLFTLAPALNQIPVVCEDTEHVSKYMDQLKEKQAKEKQAKEEFQRQQEYEKDDSRPSFGHHYLECKGSV